MPMCTLVDKTALDSKVDANALHHEVQVAKSNVMSELPDSEENVQQRNKLKKFLEWFNVYTYVFPNLFCLVCAEVTIIY